MIHAMSFARLVKRLKRNRSLMARIGLNMMGFSKEYPVSISELGQLSPENHALATAFLMWRHHKKEYTMPPSYIDLLVDAANTPPEHPLPISLRH
jgi:hypothetical protein